ncbi:MAG: protein arginine kinase [Planctomycetes bacterium]|nr:protein arginine kinase [Planctomycetota bacterium]
MKGRAPQDPGDPRPEGGEGRASRRVTGAGEPTLWNAGGAEWLKGDGPSSDVVLSSRVRLARNFAGFRFVARCTKEERSQIARAAKAHALSGEVWHAGGVIWIDLNDTPEIERQVLVERHLISQQHAKGSEPRGVAISVPDERLSIMVNEEDHLRIQVIRAGLALEHAFAQSSQVDDAVEARADYAFSSRWGYLTACPTNVGTGIRVSVMLHLPGLKLTGEIEKVKRAAGAMNLAIRGFYGEGSEAIGDLFQVSNQTTLGKCEKDILAAFEREVIPRVIEYERVARRTLMEKRRLYLEDQLFRAVGALSNARLMKSDEAMQALSMVRLGVCLGFFPRMNLARVHELMLQTQPAHLQRLARKELDQAERRVERARVLREAFSA